MNMIDVIDQALRDIGASEKQILEARTQSVSMHMNKEDKEYFYRELTEAEEIRYKGMVQLVIATVANNPVLMKQMIAEFMKDVQSN